MTTSWNTRRPGEDPNVYQDRDDPTMLVIGAGVPDRVHLPPELGGAELRVLRVAEGRCLCDTDHRSRFYVCADRWLVCECLLRHEFLWGRERMPTRDAPAGGCP